MNDKELQGLKNDDWKNKEKEKLDQLNEEQSTEELNLNEGE